MGDLDREDFSCSNYVSNLKKTVNCEIKELENSINKAKFNYYKSGRTNYLTYTKDDYDDLYEILFKDYTEFIEDINKIIFENKNNPHPNNKGLKTLTYCKNFFKKRILYLSRIGESLNNFIWDCK